MSTTFWELRSARNRPQRSPPPERSAEPVRCRDGGHDEAATLPSPRCRYRSVSRDRQRRRRYHWGQGTSAPCGGSRRNLSSRRTRPCTRPRKVISMPVTPTHAAVVLNGLPDRDDRGAVQVTVRCPHCGDRHVHGLPAPVRVVRDGTFGHRSALCGATAGYWVIDPNGRVGVILRRHAKHARRSCPIAVDLSCST